MTVRITDNDRGYARLNKALRDSHTQVTVGIHSSEGAAAKGDTDLITVAGAHEFGKGVPRRSFVIDWFDERRADLSSKLKEQVSRAVKEKVGLRVAIDRFGLLARADCQQRIKRGVGPELSEATKRRKRSSLQLVDTGQLINGITYLVGKP